MAQTMETVMPKMSEIERDFLMSFIVRFNNPHYWGTRLYLQVLLLKSL